VGWKELGIINCYTLESTFCGSDFGKYQDLHFNTNMLQSIGPKFCETILEYNFLDAARKQQILEEIEEYANRIKEQPQSNAMMEMGGQIEDEAAAGLLAVDNTGLLGIIKDEESCQDSDFSGDEKDLATAGQNGNDELPSSTVGVTMTGGGAAQPSTKTNKAQNEKTSAPVALKAEQKAQTATDK